MATFTCSAAAAGVSPKAGHVGVQAKTFFHTGTTSISASDVVLLCKVPANATVLDCAIRLFHKADTSAVLNVFLAKINDSSATAIATMGSITVSSTGGNVLFRPTSAWAGSALISLSDDATLQYAFLKVGIVSGTATTSFSCNGYVTYIMDQA